MSRSHWLVLALAVLAGFNAGTVWLMQLSVFPLWPLVGPAELEAYYQFWRHITLWLVGFPYALSALGALILLWMAPTGAPQWALRTGVALQAAIELAIWIWLRPLELHIPSASGGLDAPVFRELVTANWFRIGFATAYAVLILWTIARSLWASSGISRTRRLLLMTFGLSLYGVGNVWLVQLLCYGLWPYVGRRGAYAYHIFWWHSIWGALFIPAGVVFLGSIAMLRVRPVGVSRGIARTGFMLLLITYLLTATWWGPLMARLVTPEGGLSLGLYHLLMTTHWLRVALITAYGAASCWMLVESAAEPKWGNV